VHAVRQPCPPVLRSMGGQAQSEDDRRCSSELPIYPRVLWFSSTLGVLGIFLLSLVTVGYVFFRLPPRRYPQQLTVVDAEVARFVETRAWEPTTFK
jgi:hypothetical protein